MAINSVHNSHISQPQINFKIKVFNFDLRENVVSELNYASITCNSLTRDNFGNFTGREISKQ